MKEINLAIIIKSLSVIKRIITYLHLSESDRGDYLTYFYIILIKETFIASAESVNM